MGNIEDYRAAWFGDNVIGIKKKKTYYEFKLLIILVLCGSQFANNIINMIHNWLSVWFINNMNKLNTTKIIIFILIIIYWIITTATKLNTIIIMLFHCK